MNHLSLKVGIFQADLEVRDQTIVVISLVVLDPREQIRLTGGNRDASHINKIIFCHLFQIQSVSRSLNEAYGLLFL